MAQKDLGGKVLLSINEVFADVANVLLFKGERLIEEKDLSSADKHSQYHTDGKYHEQIRDVAKYWYFKDFQIAMFGLENETDVERVMPVRLLYGIMGTVGIVLLVLLLFIGLKARRTFANMEDAVNEYITVQGSTSEMVQASDYLTMQARSFATTGNIRFVDNYFEEANVAKRRDKAVESIQSSTAYVRSGAAEHMK